MEAGFSRSFADVRVHTGESAAESARSIAAQAYTAGRHIVFGQGHYRPDTTDGRHLIAHELTHVLQQTSTADSASAPDSSRIVQRNAIPIEELLKMRDDIDRKLANPKLSDVERQRLLEERLSLSKSIGDEDPSQDDRDRPAAPPHRTRLSTGVPPPAPNVPVTPPPETSAKPQKPKPTPPKGRGDQAKSAKALAQSEQRQRSVPPPSTSYHDQNRDNSHERRVGKILNELAIEGKLRDVRRVEGRRPVPPDTADYAFIRADGSEIKADHYRPAAPDAKAEDIALHAQTKARQADIVVVELALPASAKTLQKAHQIADAIVANNNSGLKRIVVVAEDKLILNRSLEANPRAVENVRARVPQRAVAEPRVKQRVDRLENEVCRVGDVPESGLDYQGIEGVHEVLGRQEARVSAFEGAGQIILSTLFASLQNSEVEKIYARLHELGPRIEKLRADGYYVQVMGQAEVPDSIDIAAGITDTRDISQLVYFVDLWLDPRRDLDPGPVEHSYMSGDPTGTPDDARHHSRFPQHPNHHFQSALFMTFLPYPKLR